MIVKRKAGYYVLSEKTRLRGRSRSSVAKARRNLGGPYATRAEAVRRLQQVEFFKRRSKK